MIWRIMIVITVFLEILLISYILTFESRDFTPLLWTLYYVFEIFYTLDTILLTAHKFFATHQRKRTYLPKHYLTIIIDIITLIPYYETYYILGRASRGKSYHFAKDMTKWKVMLRIYRLPTFFLSISNTPGLNHIASDTLAHIAYFMLYTVLGGCFWYYLAYSRPDFNWATQYLTYHNFNNESAMSWLIISSSVVGNLFAHNWVGLVFASREGEFFFVIISMLLGFLYHYMILFGKLTALYIKKIGDQFRFSTKLYTVVNMLNDWDVPLKTQKKVIEIYNNIWDQRSGIIDRPKMFELLPKSLRKEICLDMFWMALKHSPVFDDLDISMKRHLGLYMKNLFLMPGEYLLKTGEVNCKMIYIVSGIVQILAHQNQKSAIMSFSSGTVLGEINILMPRVSTVNLNCASYCEVHILDYCSVWRVLKKYSKSTRPIREKLGERLGTARLLQSPDLLRMKRMKDKKMTDIRWVKAQWKNISYQAKNVRKQLDEKREMVTLYHTSKYLNLYVLSEDVELKMKTICLKPTFPFILEPNSSFRKTFEYLVLGSIVIQTLLLPYMLFFERDFSLSTSAIFYTLDCFYVLGLIFDVSTAVKKTDRIISTLGQILIYKGKQLSFLVDLIATLPLEMLGMSSPDPGFKLLRINRLLKIYKVFTIIKKAELNVWVHYIQIRIVKYLTLIICSMYLLATACYGMASFPEDNYHEWFFYNQGLRKILDTEPQEELSHFLLAIEFVLTIILSQSWRTCFAYSTVDILVEFLIVLIGYFIYSFCFAEVGACAILSHQSILDYQSYMSSLTTFANRRHVPSGTKYFMYSMVQCHWEYNGRFEISGQKSIIRQLPEHLRNKVLVSRVVRVLRLIPVFFECEEAVLWRVASKMAVNIFPPKSILLQQDCFSAELNVIVRGYCIAESYVPTDKYHEVQTNLTIGDCFPLLEMLMFINSFLRVTAATYVEVATISYRDLMDALDKESVLYSDLQEVVNWHFAANKIILSRQKGRLPEMVSTQKAQERGDFFEYEINDEVVRLMERTYNLAVWKRLGHWRFLRHLCLKITIDPRKKFYIAWECYRCTVLVLNIGYSLFFVHYIVMPYWHRYMTYLFLLTALVDFYIRMHCRYFNTQGILVTHPLYTTKYYFSTSFLIDFFCVLPFRELQFQNFFGSYKEYGLLILMLATRPLLVYRIFNGITYLQKRSTRRAVLYHNLKYVIVVFVAISIANAILEEISCPRDSHSAILTCPNDTWIYQDVFKGQQYPYLTSLICHYVTMSMFTTSTVGLFSFQRKAHFLCVAFLSFMLLAIRWFMLAKITSSRIGGNTTLVHYQHNMKEFLKFSKKFYLKSPLVEETVAHYEYLWKRTKGSTIKSIMPSFHPVLRADFCAFFYEPTMKMTEILSNLELSAVRQITPHFKEWHYKKDADIIRCNDVTELIYIVHKGSVEITIANTTLALLTQGGMFGNLSSKGKSRLTIRAKAVIHVDLLVMEAVTFYKVIARYPTAVNRINRNRLSNSEYVTPISDQGAMITDPTGTLYSKSYIERPRWKKILMFTIKSDNKWLLFYNYVLSVHVSMFSSLAVMTLIVKVGAYDIWNYYQLSYFFDFIFITRIILGFHTTYIDPDSGIVIRKYSKIWKNHAKSSHFWFSIFTSIPFEILYYFVRDEAVYRYCWINRVLRFFFLFRYYSNCKDTLTVSKHLRWTYLMYSMLFLIHINVCIWWKIACPQEKCLYLPKVNHEPLKLIYTNDTKMAFRLAYIYVINVFTSTGLKQVVPTNTYELITSIIMVGLSQLVMIVLTAGFASMLLLEKFEMTNFEKGSRKVVKYLQKVNLSIFLKRKVWRYYVEQWTTAHGNWLPLLIENAPSYLKEDMMYDLYSKHLLKHFLFKKTHTDFIRQLTAQLQLVVFLPGMNIVEKGDIDGCIYFIDEGEVVVYDVVNKIEIEVMVLTHKTSFGEPQGLYNTPHERTYKARYTTKVLTLRRGTWEYLMDWFPASKEQIIQQSGRRFKPSQIGFMKLT